MSDAANASDRSEADPSAAEPWRTTAPPREFTGADAPPLIATEAVPACPVCGGRDFDTYAVGFDYELKTCANPWRFVRCRSCTHVWLNPRPAIEALSTIYPPTYYAYNYGDQISGVAVAAKQMLDRLKFAALLRWLGRPPATYLDIGCGDGRFLRLMEKHGLPRDRLFGLELDQSVIDRLAAEGYRAHNRRVEDFEGIEPGTLDLATMFHVIEHVDDPGAVADRVSRWLSPGGVFAVETPNLDSLDARRFRQTYWGGYHIPRHWNLFTQDTLGRLLSDRGLEVLGTAYQTGHSFWMYSMHHVTRYRPGRERPGLSRWFDPCGGTRALPGLSVFTGFDKLRAGLGQRTSAMLMIARKPG